MKPKIRTELILLFFLMLLGAAILSPYARWIVTTTFANVFELLGHIALLIATVFLYCFGATAFFGRSHQGYMVSPVLVWIYIWLINLIENLHQGGIGQDVPSITSTVMMNLFALAGLLYISYPQQFLLRKAFGFDGDEKDCYCRSYTSVDFEKILNIILEKNWLYNITGLSLRKRLEPNRLKMKAYSNSRRCYLFFFVEKIEKSKVIFNIVAYVKNATNFASFISSPDWFRELVDNLVLMIRSKGIKLEENESLLLKRESLEYALNEVRPLVSRDKMEKVSLPLVFLTFLIIAFMVTYFFTEIEISLAVEVVTLVLAFIIFIVDYFRKK